jgi:hypothetical protein
VALPDKNQRGWWELRPLWLDYLVAKALDFYEWLFCRAPERKGTEHGIPHWVLRILGLTIPTTAICKCCGKRGDRADMISHPVYGWFCSEEHFHKYWLSSVVSWKKGNSVAAPVRLRSGLRSACGSVVASATRGLLAGLKPGPTVRAGGFCWVGLREFTPPIRKERVWMGHPE